MSAAEGPLPPRSVSGAVPPVGLGADLDEVVAHRAILCVTGPSTADVTRALDDVLGGRPETVRIRAAAPGDRAALATALYEELALERPRPRSRDVAEERIAGELGRAPRLVVVEGAEELRTAALEALYGLWAYLGPGYFPLVLAGDVRLEKVLDRPALASLTSYVYIHHHLPYVG